MTEWQNELLAGDPLQREPSLPTADAQRMRRVVLAAAEPVSSRATGFIMALACSLSLAAGAGLWAVRQGADDGIDDAQAVATTGVPGATVPDPPPIERRQVQFATPGGTRVIWVIETVSN